MKIKLKDGTELTMLDATDSSNIVAQFTSVDEIEAFRAKLTDDSLSAFQYVDDKDVIVGEYENYTFESVSYTDEFVATFSIRQLSDIEVRLAAVEAGQDAQDSAIGDLANIMGGE